MIVERAAEVIRGLPSWDMPQALVDAGWHDGPKLTDADRAVLDAADAWESAHHVDAQSAADDLAAAVRARRETQP